MRTRNKAAKEQTSNRARPKRGGTETPEPKTPSKQTNGSSPNVVQPTTPGKKKGKNEKAETPSKSRKRGQEKMEETVESEEKDLGLFKKKRERAEVTRYFFPNPYYVLQTLPKIVTYAICQ